VNFSVSSYKPTIINDINALSPSLHAVIDEAYSLFGHRSIGIPFGVCKCNVCCSDENEQLLAKTNLRNISSALLSEYTNSAHGYDEFSDGHTLRYFLPRYLELIALNDPPHYGDLSHCLGRLGKANYRSNWPAAETELLDRYFDALLTDKLNDVTVVEWPVGFRLRYPIDDLMEMMVLAGGDVDRLLRAWQNAAQPGQALHTASLALKLTSKDGEMLLSSQFLTDHKDACLAIGRFICQPEQMAALEQAFFMLEDRPESQQIISDGQSLIGSWLR
jgi:hypothetical protein